MLIVVTYFAERDLIRGVIGYLPRRSGHPRVAV